MFRFMRGEKLHLIRHHNEANPNALTVEVWCADENYMSDLEKAWIGHLRELIILEQRKLKSEEPNHGS
jgi:hypothetical protein